MPAKNTGIPNLLAHRALVAVHKTYMNMPKITVETQNHRRFWVERGLKDLLVPTPLLWPGMSLLWLYSCNFTGTVEDASVLNSSSEPSVNHISPKIVF